uniref:Teleost multiple tissue opsin 2b n=1 Tax=Sinocyclocheilus rhinocerous TaxID=307959 RepID=A0A673KDP3_9TELE
MPLYYTPVARSAKLAHSAGILKDGFTAGTEKHFASRMQLCTLSRAGFIALSVFLGFIMTFGFFNNFVVLVLFCKFKTLRTPVYMLLLNISVSDMLVCMFGTTMSFASSVRGRWLLGRHGCMWYGFINSCFGIVSLISLVVLSYDRYSTLTVYHNRGPDYRKPLLAVGGSWLYSLIWTVPPLLGWSSYEMWDIHMEFYCIINVDTH